MQFNKLDRTLAVAVLLVAAFNTVASLTMPVPAWRRGTALVVAWLLVLVVHAALYWFGDSMRVRLGLKPYVAAQAAIVFFMGVTAGISPVVVGLYIALITDVIIIAGERWGVLPITLGAIVAFAANTTIAWDFYRGASAGLVLVTTAIVVAAAVRLSARARPVPAIAQRTEPQTDPRAPELTARELQVLRAIAQGARSAQIASDLGIAERTVKAHLASIYQKLRVESRAAAVAIAVGRGLTSKPGSP